MKLIRCPECKNKIEKNKKNYSCKTCNYKIKKSKIDNIYKRLRKTIKNIDYKEEILSLFQFKEQQGIDCKQLIIEYVIKNKNLKFLNTCYHYDEFEEIISYGFSRDLQHRIFYLNIKDDLNREIRQITEDEYFPHVKKLDYETSKILTQNDRANSYFTANGTIGWGNKNSGSTQITATILLENTISSFNIFNRFYEDMTKCFANEFVSLFTKDKSIFVEEYKILEWVNNYIYKQQFKENTIINKLLFKPEYKQAGISILNYFAEVLKTKLPDLHAPIEISQDGNLITLSIQTENGTKQIVQKTLDTYISVVTKYEKPTKLFNKDTELLEIQRLENKLELAAVEIKQNMKLLNFQENVIKDLQQDKIVIKELMGIQLKQGENINNQYISSITNNNVLQEKLIYLLEAIKQGDVNKSYLVETVTELKKENKEEASTFLEVLENTMYGASSNSVFLLIQGIIKNSGF